MFSPILVPIDLRNCENSEHIAMGMEESELDFALDPDFDLRNRENSELPEESYSRLFTDTNSELTSMQLAMAFKSLDKLLACFTIYGLERVKLRLMRELPLPMLHSTIKGLSAKQKENDKLWEDIPEVQQLNFCVRKASLAIQLRDIHKDRSLFQSCEAYECFISEKISHHKLHAKNARAQTGENVANVLSDYRCVIS